MPEPTGPAITITDAAPSTVPIDTLIVPGFEDEAPAGPWLDPTAGRLTAAYESREFKGKPFESLWLPIVADGWRASRVLIVGAGRRRDWSTELARRVATAAGLFARQRRRAHVAIALPSEVDLSAFVQPLAEGLMLAAFDGDVYKTVERDAGPLESGIVLVPQVSPALDALVKRGRVLGGASNIARAWANEPSNMLTPPIFAERASALATGAGLEVTILDESAIAALDMRLVLAVARGSAEPPRVMVVRYTPPGVSDGPVLGLVGKGITFDTGGISIKPAEGMDRMKDDMAGGAAVLAAMHAIATLKAPIRVVGIVPATENMPGGRAMKPGDVIRGASGKTVEVLNTDAEGRLILADALWYATAKAGATHLVDVATLTGACVVALGKVASGLFGTPDPWVQVVRETAERAGDRVWQLPIYDEYLEQIRSEIADLANVGGRPAGASTAAVFLKEFSGGVPWAHLDIAGTAWTEEPKPYQPKGANGVAVRTLAELAFTADRWPASTPETTDRA